MRNWRQIPENRFLFLVLTGVMLFLVGVIIITNSGAVQFHPLAALGFLLNITLFMAQLLRAINRHPFSFDMMHWLFCLFFLGYAPFLQHLTNTYSWGLHPTVGEVICTNLICSLWSVCYLLGRDYRQIPVLLGFAERVHALAQPVREKLQSAASSFDSVAQKLIHRLNSDRLRDNSRLSAHRKTSLKTKVLCVMLVCAVVCALCDLVFVGVLAQISRSTAAISTGNTALDLIANHGVNNLLLFVAVVFILEAKNSRKLQKRTVIALLCLFLACFPTGLSRNMMASFYAGLLIISFDKTRKGRWFSWAIIGGLVFIFPAMEVFRRIKTLQQSNLLELILDSFTSSYLEGHFDSHQMFISVARYVEQFGLSWGKQLLGALLFFVPRSVWPGKPEGTGHTAIVALDQFYFSNVSANLATEGYVNFGVLGVVLFACAVGILTRRFDEFYWRQRQDSRENKLGDILYPFTMFMFFFMMRGDMMSSWAYTFTQAVIGTVVCGVYLFVVRWGECDRR